MMVLLSSRAWHPAGRLGPAAVHDGRPLLMAVGSLLLLTVSPDFSYWTQVLPSMIVLGLGLAITVSPHTSAILGAIETERSGIASAVNNAVSRVAGLMTIAALAAIVGGSLDLTGLQSRSDRHRRADGRRAAGCLSSASAIRDPWMPPPRRPDNHDAGDPTRAVGARPATLVA